MVAGLGLLAFAFAQPFTDAPVLDTSLHSVDLNDIYFDTFQRTNRAIALPDASESLILRLRDAIPPIHNPVYESASQAAKWLKPDDDILGYSINGKAWAFPVRILNFHEIVNETFEGQAVLISYCPLCFSGIVYSREVNGRTLTFGNTSALYDSDMVMLDYETGSYWWQVAGKAIVGTLTDEELTALPSNMMRFEDWITLHPESLVLSRDTGFDRPYQRDAFVGYDQLVNNKQFAFPLTEESQALVTTTALPPATRVLSVKINNESRAYPLEETIKQVIHDDIAGNPIVIFQNGLNAGAFELEKTHSSFTLKGNDFKDEATNTLWDLSGRAIEGPLVGSSLKPLPVKTTYWFAILGAEPEITIYRNIQDH